MAKRSQRGFMKRQKEVDRKKKAQGRMTRRQGEKTHATAVEEQDGTERPEK